MLEYDFKIMYWPRCENKVIDTLSYYLQFIGELQAYLVIQMVGVKGAQQEINNDERLQKIIQELIV